MTKVLIAGTFDILHPGHINLIKQAQSLGNFLVIVVARDQTVIKVKERAPYFNEEQRLTNLQEILLKNSKNQIPKSKQIQNSKLQTQIFFKIVLGDIVDPYNIINEEKPDIIALGYDQEKFVAGLKKWIHDTRPATQVVRLKPFKENVCKGKNIRKAVEDKQAGFLLIDKPNNWTSHDIVAKLRSIIGIRQIGHTGTLDPFATGLLICAISQATKMVEMFNVLPKTYEATIKLGVTSDTYDRTGQVTSYKRQDTKKLQIKNSKIQTILESFVGKQQQLPPMFSAKKVQGRKLYKLARQGKEIERKPANIEFYNIELLGIRNKELRIMVKCSTGTYIRTLAQDIGQKLETGAILEELKRTAIGNFSINEAVQLSQLTKDNYEKFLIKPLEALNWINEDYLFQ